MATRTEQPILIGNVAGAWSAGPRRRDEPGPLLRFTAGAVVVMFVISMLVLSTVLYLYATIPLPTLPPLTQTTILTDRSGRPITELHAAVDRTVIPFDEMPMGLRRAVIAVEDNTSTHTAASIRSPSLGLHGSTSTTHRSSRADPRSRSNT